MGSDLTTRVEKYPRLISGVRSPQYSSAQLTAQHLIMLKDTALGSWSRQIPVQELGQETWREAAVTWSPNQGVVRYSGTPSGLYKTL